MPFGRSGRLRIYVLVVAGGALLLLLGGTYNPIGGQAQFWNTVGVLLGTGLLAEAVALQLRHGTTRSAVSFVPFLAALVLVGPTWAMVIAGSTELVAETLLRRKAIIKIIHNSSKEVIAIGAAGLLYSAAGGVPVLAAGQLMAAEFTRYFNIPGFLAASVAYFVVTNGLTATAVSLSMDVEISEVWNQMVGKVMVENVLSSSISVLLAYLYVALGIFGLVLVLAPLFFVRHAHQNALRLEQTNRDLLELMVKSIEARDPYTSGHSLRVAAYARALARALGLTLKEIEQIETAALLHDVGKIYEEFAPILRKEGKMDEDERLLMHTHPGRSAELVGTISSLRGHVEKCVRAHHESYDGGGYPDGLAGDEIPIGARIIMIADTADAMMTDRPYRKAMDYDRVVSELERFSGTQFDPVVVAVFKNDGAVRRLIEGRRGTGDHVQGWPYARVAGVWGRSRVPSHGASASTQKIRSLFG